MNDKPFAPELAVVLRLPLEPTHDNNSLDPNFYENLGKELASLLENKKCLIG